MAILCGGAVGMAEHPGGVGGRDKKLYLQVHALTSFLALV